MSRPFAAPAVFACLLAVSACAPPGGAVDDDQAATLAGTEWALREVAGMPVAGAAWIGFQGDGTAGGNAGCNQFGADYRRDGTALVFDDIQSTMMACADPARMNAETAFVGALQATRQAIATESLLLLRDADGEVVATLARRA